MVTLRPPPSPALHPLPRSVPAVCPCPPRVLADVAQAGGRSQGRRRRLHRDLRLLERPGDRPRQVLVEGTLRSGAVREGRQGRRPLPHAAHRPLPPRQVELWIRFLAFLSLFCFGVALFLWCNEQFKVCVWVSGACLRGCIAYLPRYSGRTMSHSR